MCAMTRERDTSEPDTAELPDLTGVDVRCLQCGERARLNLEVSPAAVLWIRCHARPGGRRCDPSAIALPITHPLRLTELCGARVPLRLAANGAPRTHGEVA